MGQLLADPVAAARQLIFLATEPEQEQSGGE